MNKLKIESFGEFSFPNSLNISPDGSKLLYAISKADLEDNKYNTNLYFYDFEKKHHVQLTNSNSDSFKLFEDDKKVLFTSARDQAKNKDDKKKLTSFYTISLEGGEAVKSFDLEISVTKIAKLKDDKYLIIGDEFHDDKDFREIEKLPFYLNGQGYTHESRSFLYSYNRKNGELKKVSDPAINVDNFEIDEDMEKALVIYTNVEKTMTMYNSVGLLDLDTFELTKISQDKTSYAYANFYGEKVLYAASDLIDQGINDNNKIFTMDKEGENIKMLCKEDFDFEFYNSIGTDVRYGANRQAKIVGKKFYFIATINDCAHLLSLDNEGNVDTLLGFEGSVEGFDIVGDRFVYAAMKDLNLTEIFQDIYGSESKLTDFSKALEGYKLSEIESFMYENDGIEFDGYVIKPVDYEKGQKYPALLEIHGGPKTAYGRVLHHEMQLLANQGYFVFFTNPRGSSGRGVKFSDIRGKYGTIDYSDLMTFTDKVLENYPDIDTERLGVLGGSYGGFMTNWIIGHTDRFKAANTQRSICNWTSFYGTSDIGYYFASDQTAATPWKNFDLLWESSPIKYFDKVKTPTLIIHSEEDYRCPLEQGMQVFNALRVHNIDTKLVIFKGENHDLSRSGRPKSRVKRLEEIIAWFNKYLK